MRKRLRKLKTLADLSFDDKNANRGTDRGRRLVAHSLERYGAGRSVLTDRAGKLIAGNKMVEQARAAGMPIRVVPSDGRELVVVQRTDLDMDQDQAARELAIADNRAGELGLDWDPETLELLRGEGLDLDAMFDQAELDELINSAAADSEAAPVEDEAAVARMIDQATALNRKWKVKRGQLWTIGKHRVLCGDATVAGDVDRLMQGSQADLIFTDPPYNLAAKNLMLGYTNKAKAVLTGAAWDKNFAIRPALDLMLEALSDNASVYVCASHYTAPEIWQWMAGFAKVYGFCVWSKPNPMPSLSRRQWTWAAELIAYATRGRHVFNFPDEGHALNVWTIRNLAKCEHHPTQKPIDIPAQAIAHSSKPGDRVIDFFVGSGTTAIAAERLKRACYAMEIDPAFVAVALERMSCAYPDLKFTRQP